MHPLGELWRWQHVQNLGKTFIRLRVCVDLTPEQRREVQVGNRDLFLWYELRNDDLGDIARVSLYGVWDGRRQLEVVGEHMVADTDVVGSNSARITDDYRVSVERSGSVTSEGERGGMAQIRDQLWP